MFTCSWERQRVEREHGARDKPSYTGFGHSIALSFRSQSHRSILPGWMNNPEGVEARDITDREF